MGKFRDIDPEALFKQIPVEDAWIPRGHLARFVLEIVSQMDLSEFERAYKGCGRKPYPPGMLLAMLIYGYVTGVFSSRKIEEATYDSIAFRFLAGNTHPDHSSLAGFRKRFQNEFKDIFFKVLLVANEMGIVRMGRIAVDGTKIGANASKHTALSYGHAEKIEAQLKEEVTRLMAEAAKADNAEITRIAIDFPAEIALRKDRLAGIAAAMATIEARAAERHARELATYEEKIEKRKAKEEATGKKLGGTPLKEPVPGPRPGDQVNLSDEQSRIMPAPGGGFVQGYNAQVAADLDTMMVMATTVTQATNDKEQVKPMIAAAKAAPASLGAVTTFVADNGYCSAFNVQTCLDAGIDPVIAVRREDHHPDCMERFTEPAPLPEGATALQTMAHKLLTAAGRKLYALRKQTVEPVFGIIKSVMGFRRFSMRGLAAASNEWDLVCLAWNIKRMAVLRP